MTQHTDTRMSAVGRLAVRLLAAFSLSAGCLYVLVTLTRTVSPLQRLNLVALPVSVLVGLMPLIYWYRRDAYPIGLIYCPTAFYILLKVGSRILGP